MTEIELFSGPNCSYCEAAKTLLDTSGLAYTEHNVAEPDQLAELQRRLPRTTSIPQIFVDGEHIGSTEDLEARARSSTTPFHLAT